MGRWLIGCVDEERACEMKKKKKREEEGIESNCVREYNKIIICKAIVTVYICTVTVASMDICKGIQALMWMGFEQYCVNFTTFSIIHPLMRLLRSLYLFIFDNQLGKTFIKPNHHTNWLHL